MANSNHNLFREAKELLQKKDAGGELTEEELELVRLVTTFVANEMPKAFPECEERTISEDLEELVEMVKEK